MRGRLVLMLLMGFTLNCFSQNAWKKDRLQVPFPMCYGSDESHKCYVGPPAEYYNRLKSASTLKADIVVTYVGFSSEAQEAFQFAVDIWKNMIYSPVPIRIKAVWQSLDKGVLGSCGPTGYYKNFNATQLWNCYYPVAIVEKMLGEEVNSPEQFDLEARFNKDFANWYLGTDGNTPSRNYDFVSVVLHELTHGLGFSGLFYTFDGKGAYSYGNDNIGGIFDQHVINKAGEKLVNKSLFTDPSVNLHQALTSGWLDFNTRLSNNQLPHLYAPAIWDEGSSIYHLDDSTYPGGNSNSLMTPFTGTGEAIHSPGEHSLAIMYEMGWKTLTVKHERVKDIEMASSPVDFNATIVSDYSVDSTKVYLVYSTNRWVKKDSIPMKQTDVSANYTVRLFQFKSGEVDYYFSATDQNQRRFVFPSNAPARYLYFKIGVDNVQPVVKHEPLKFMISSNPSALIEAEVTDNIGIKTVRIDYFVNGGAIKQIPMQLTGTDLYSGILSFPDGTVKGGDRVSYRIVSVDASSQSNIGKSPLTGYYSFTVEKVEAPADKYVNNFNGAGSDFIGSDFTVSKPAGFDSPGLNSAHPYVSPDTDNMHFDFSAILRNPIILKEGGKMSYDEIVLVEPGEDGVSYGDDDFYDYIIVEGSNDGGQSWKPLIDGYDSNAQQSWYNLFISSTSGNNSNAVPTPDLFVRREFELLANGNFKAGETIFIRFRLFSDPYSNGWGWILDNLSIQDNLTGNQPLVISSGEVIFYPNPASGKLNIQIQSRNSIGRMSLKAYNSSGAMVYSQTVAAGSHNFNTDIDVSGFIPGLYLFSVEPEKGRAITRKILVQ